MLEIEVRLANGGFYKAFVQSVDQETMLVTFESDWQPAQTVTYDQCRLPPYSDGHSTGYKDGEIIECMAKNSANDGYGWHQARVKQIKGEFAVVEFISPEVMGPGATDVLSFDRCRPLNLGGRAGGSLTADSFKHDTINVPEDLRHFSTRPDAYSEFAKNIKSLFVQYDEPAGKLHIKSCYPQSLKRARVLEDMYFKDMRQRMQLIQRQEEAKKQLQSTCNPSKHVEEFTVPFDLMGLAIGTHGTNIQNARAIVGIEDIQLVETDGAPCLFKVQGTFASVNTLLTFLLNSDSN